MVYSHHSELRFARAARADGCLWCVQLAAVWFAYVLLLSQPAIAQEVSFTPRFDGTDQDLKPLAQPTAAPSPDREKQIYSFARFSGFFKDMCAALRVDMREKRVFAAGTKGLAESGDCGTCRALCRQVVQWCRPESDKSKSPSKRKPTPTPAPTATPESASEESVEQQEGEALEGQSEEQSTESAQAQEEEGGQEENTPDEQEVSDEAEDGEEQGEKPTPSPTPSPSATPQPARYPSTELIDATSRLSQSLYELEPGFGAAFNATQRLSRDLLQQKDLTPAERDYYSILSAYLLSAWEGRPGSPLDPRVQAQQDVSELFQ